MLKALENEIDAVKVQGNDGGVTKPANFLFEMLEKCGITAHKKQYLFEILTRLLQYFGAQLPNPRRNFLKRNSTIKKNHVDLYFVFIILRS